MDIPGHKDEYKNELYESLETEYETSEISVPTMSKVYKKEHSGIFAGQTEYIGIVDQRNITPESLKQSLDKLMDKISGQTSLLGALANEPRVIIIGVSDHVSGATREFINNGATEHNRTYPFDIYVIDVKAGTILGTDKKYVPQFGAMMKKNHLKKPMD